MIFASRGIRGIQKFEGLEGLEGFEGLEGLEELEGFENPMDSNIKTTKTWEHQTKKYQQTSKQTNKHIIKKQYIE